MGRSPSQIFVSQKIKILYSNHSSHYHVLCKGFFKFIKIQFCQKNSQSLVKLSIQQQYRLLTTDKPEIRETAATVNLQLTKLVSEAPISEAPEERLDLDAVVEVLTELLHHSSVHTRTATLDWILHLYNKLPVEVSVALLFWDWAACVRLGAI